jgi:hypothetical protein
MKFDDVAELGRIARVAKIGAAKAVLYFRA